MAVSVEPLAAWLPPGSMSSSAPAALEMSASADAAPIDRLRAPNARLCLPIDGRLTRAPADAVTSGMTGGRIRTVPTASATHGVTGCEVR